ncbi:MAG: right-handed parallel beta-helix repeat-containing protein [Planctomycetaceae bacterium]
MLLRIGHSANADYATLHEGLAVAKVGTCLELEGGEHELSDPLTFPVTIRAAKEVQTCLAHAEILSQTGHKYAHVILKSARGISVELGPSKEGHSSDAPPTVTLQGLEITATSAGPTCELKAGMLRLVDCVVVAGNGRRGSQGIVAGLIPAKGTTDAKSTFATLEMSGGIVRGRFSDFAVKGRTASQVKIKQTKFLGNERGVLALAGKSAAELLECEIGEFGLGIDVADESQISLKLCRFEKGKGCAVRLSKKSVGELVGCDFVELEANAIQATGKSRLKLDRCEFEGMKKPAILLDGALRSVLGRLRGEKCGAVLLDLRQGTNANLTSSVLAEEPVGCTSAESTNWQLGPDCHLVQIGNRGEKPRSEIAASTSSQQVAECPFCYERVATAGGKGGATSLCPACGWTFSSNKKGELASAWPLEVRCQGELCVQVFPASAAGSDLCPDCLTLCHWDNAGYPTQTRCPECDGQIPLPRWTEAEASAWCQCPACKSRVRVDRQGMILEFGDDEGWQ